MNCILEFTKGHNFVKTSGGLTILAFSTLSYDVLYLYQVLRNYLIQLQSYRLEQYGRR